MEEKFPILLHIEDLRKKTIQYLISLLILIILSFMFIDEIAFLFLRPIDQKLVFLSPIDGFAIIFKLALTTAFILSLPILFFQIWRFISLGLTHKEKSKLRIYLPISFILFLTGILFAYFIVIPSGLKFLISYGSKFFQPMISAREYISFITTFLLILGLIFQLPLIILFLNSAGIMSKEQLKTKRKYFYLIAFILGAVLTPTPDAFTQILVAVPIILLYELSYIIILFKNKV